MNLTDLKKSKEAPGWLTSEGLKKLQKGYLQDGETPRDMWRRVSKAAAKHMDDSDSWEEKFFKLFWNGWLAGSTPVLANMGTSRGLPISCFGSYIPDNTEGIMYSLSETAMLSKMGGGTSGYLGDIRPKGSPIAGGGEADSKLTWLRMIKSVISGISQGGVRRGSFAAYVEASDPEITEIMDWMQQKKVEDEEDRKSSAQMHLGVNWRDADLDRVLEGDDSAWKKHLELRFEKGLGYMQFSDKIDRLRPQVYIDKDMKVKASNLCNEIQLPAYTDETFVCCLSSMNLAKWDEWKDTSSVFDATVFLDCVIEEFISLGYRMSGERALNHGVSFLERAIKFAQKHRALGLGTLGYHTYLQKHNLPFSGFQSMMINNQIFSRMQKDSLAASKWLADVFGEPKVLKGYGVRNTTNLAIAPNTSSALICGGVSQGIEPIVANCYVQNLPEGVHIRKNPQLEKILSDKGINTTETWLDINANNGSVQHVDYLSDEEKEVFKTAYEINQFEILRQANARQRYIDQGQSLNIFLPEDCDPQYLHDLHMAAAKSSHIKGLYYLRSKSGIQADTSTDCSSCEG